MNLSTPIQYLKGIGEKRAAAFAKLGIFTVEDLLYHFPRGYEDWQKIYAVKDAPLNENVAVKGVIIADAAPVNPSSRRPVFRTCASDGSHLLHITIFNNIYAAMDMKEDAEFVFYGKIKINDYGAREMVSPKYEKAGNEGYLHPVYRATAELNSKAIAKAVKTALDSLSDSLSETLPKELILKYRLSGIKNALYSIHFPKSEDDIRAAKRRLIYEELLILQLGILSHGKKGDEKTRFRIGKDFTAEFFAALPFELTNAQKRAIGECVSDMNSYSPMRRLLQGDVGSGKTAVAAALMYNTVKNSYQCALMAPTEVLAIQHYETFRRFFADKGINIVLLTGSTTAKNKRIIKEEIASGKADIIIGTHAIITDDTVFNNCALVITDEQHRFGVNQRAALREKGESPHVLVMSATPIPRTLSLIIYGDLAISVLDEKPAGRKEIKTVCVPSYYHERIYSFIKKEVRKGRQCYIVCPMVEDSDEAVQDRLSAEQYHKLLSGSVFGEINVGLLHGKMKPKKKDEIMTAFKNGDIDVLICTVVIEVGVDVPNANIMVIENAECFGLSQLHQLRGRVGRGSEQSHCILISDTKSEQSRQRFDILCETNDGFIVAEEDLKLRGPGDFFGSRQSGLPMMKLASLLTDSRILYAARDDALRIIEDDPFLEKGDNVKLSKKVSELFADIS